jgi:hypothetical protein
LLTLELVVSSLLAVANIDYVEKGLIDAEGIDPHAEMLRGFNNATGGQFAREADEIDINIGDHIVSAGTINYRCHIAHYLVMKHRGGHGPAFLTLFNQIISEEDAIAINERQDKRLRVLGGQQEKQNGSDLRQWTKRPAVAFPDC